MIHRSKRTYKLPALRDLREDKELTQQRLAELADVGRITIVRLERGDMGANGITLAKLAKALGVNRDALLMISSASTGTEVEERVPA